MADRRERIWRTGGRLGRVLAARAVHLVQVLGRACSTAPSPRRRSATRARYRRGGAARRSPPRAGGTAPRRRLRSRRRRRVHYCVGGATKLYGAALYRLREEDFGELRHHDGISPAWPISYEEMEPYYTLAEQRYEVHGARGEDPTEPPASRHTRSRRSATSRASSSSPTTSRPPGCTRSTRRAACGSHEADMPHSHCVRCATCDGFPCLVHAEVRRGGARRPAGARARQRDAAHQRRGGAPRDERRRAAPSPASSSSAAASARRSPATSSSCPAAPRTARGCCSRRRATRTRTGSPTAPARSAATTCSTTARRCWRSPRSRTRRSSRRRSGSTTSTSAATDFDFPLGNIQMVGKSSAEMYRGEKPLQTRLAPRVHARRRSPGTRSTSGCRPRTCRGRRTASRCATDGSDPAQLHAVQRGAQAAAAARAQVDARATSACTTTTWSRGTRTSRTRSRWRAARTRPARAGSAPIPRRRC